MSKFFINRPIVAMVISIIMVIVGLVTMVGLPIAQFPKVVPPEIFIQANYVGADAQTIEQSVATPIEQQMSGVDNMNYMYSINANNGLMRMFVNFDLKTDPNIDHVLTQLRYAQAESQLPADVRNFGVTVQKSLSAPLVLVSLNSPKQTRNAEFLANYAYINLSDPLSRVPGISQVQIFGAGQYAMRIWVKPDQLAKLNLTVPEIINAVSSQNTVNPAGKLGGRPMTTAQPFTYTVRAQGRLVSEDEFANIVLRAAPDGSIVRLKDVARIELGAADYDVVGRFNSKPSAVLALYQLPGSNAIEAARGVERMMAELKERFPSDLDYQVAIDTTKSVTEGIREIGKTFWEALALVMLVVFIFLQGWRAALIPLLAVPVSLIGTFAVFPLLGFSINTLSLFGLVLAIGLVVDDAIVVVEAVEHHIEEGLSPKDATLKAMEEVSGPVAAIALILASVFIPVGFMSGIQGRLNKQFAITIAISVMISAFNALTLSPALSAMLLKPRQQVTGPLSRFFAAFNRGFETATRGYVRVSHGLVRKAFVGIALLAALTALAAGVGRRLPTSFVPEEDYGYFLINLQLPPAASLERTDAVTRKIDQLLAHTEGIAAFNTIAGFSLLSFVTADNYGFYFVRLTPWDERTRPDLDARRIVNRVNKELRQVAPEATAFAMMPPSIPGLGTQGGFSFWLQDRTGGSIESLDQSVQTFLGTARKRPELAGLASQFTASVPQLFADVDRDKVLKQGVALGDVYQTMQTFLGGAYVNQFNRFGRQWKVYLQAEPEYRISADKINSFYVRNSKGEMTPLASMVTVKRVSGPEYTNRFNLFRSIQINGSPAPGYSSGQAMAAMEQVAAEVLPAGMGYAWSDMSYQEKKAEGGQAIVFGMSIFCVFLILAALYESWSLPFSVLLSVPVAVLGANAGLLLRKLDNNVFAQIGLVMLIGLTAKNAILIVEFAILENKNNKKGLVEAALEGARLRLRPILMTSFAFILGCVPLWTAKGAGAIGRRVLGSSVITGMTAAT